MDISLHHRTPILAAIDPRCLAVRAIAYARSEIETDAEARITRSAFDAAGRAIAQWDARFWVDGETEGEDGVWGAMEQ
jgi:insecticidal toxin complex protein TccC